MGRTLDVHGELVVLLLIVLLVFLLLDLVVLAILVLVQVDGDTCAQQNTGNDK